MLRSNDWFRTLPETRRVLLQYVVLVVAVTAAYANVFHNAFVFDDYFLIVNNEYLRSWNTFVELVTSPTLAGSQRTGGFYRPVPAILHFLIYQAFGLSTVAFHTLNIALHTINACLVCRVARTLGVRRWPSLVAALLWSVHPLHTEAVTFMAATPELLWVTFSLMGLVVLVPSFTRHRFFLATVLFISALGCKETAIIFPALASLCLFCVHQNRLELSIYRKTWLLWSIGVIHALALVMWLHITHQNVMPVYRDADYSLYVSSIVVRVLTSLATVPTYLQLVLWPSGLHMERTFPVFDSACSLQVMAGLAIVALGMFKISRDALHARIATQAPGGKVNQLVPMCGLTWCFISFAPVSGVVIPINALVSEHWMYFPMIGLFLAGAASATSALEKHPRLAELLVIAVAIALATATHFQNRVWENAITFNNNIISNGGRPERARDNLATAYMQKGQFEEAIEQVTMLKTLTSDTDGSRMAALHTDLALAYLRVYPDESLAITTDSFVRALRWHGGQRDKAISELNAAILAGAGRNSLPYVYLALIYSSEGDQAKASWFAEEAHRIDQISGR